MGLNGDLSASEPALGKKKSGTVKEYAEEFIKWLDSSNPIFPSNVQEGFFAFLIGTLFSEIRSGIDKEVEESIRQKGSIDDQEIGRILKAQIRQWKLDWETKFTVLSHLPPDHGKKSTDVYAKILTAVRNEVFKNHVLEPDVVADLDAIVQAVVSRDVFHPGVQSGVVVAGFGEDELFPSVQAYSTEGVFNGRLKYKREEKQSGSIDFNAGSRIIPFAQTEEAVTFIRSVSPSFQNTLNGYLATLFQEYPKQVANVVKISHTERDALAKTLDQAGDRLLQDFRKRIEGHASKDFLRDDGTPAEPIGQNFWNGLDTRAH